MNEVNCGSTTNIYCKDTHLFHNLTTFSKKIRAHKLDFLAYAPSNILFVGVRSLHDIVSLKSLNVISLIPSKWFFAIFA